jgi:hypothetical protein
VKGLSVFMAYSKTFPRTIKGSAYPVWEEIFLTDSEEAETEQESRYENIQLMKECIKDADRLINETGLKKFQSNLLSIAIALFDKRASHTIHHKENRAKAKFDSLFLAKK